MTDDLSPRPHHRLAELVSGIGWRHRARLRKIAAAALVVLAAVLALAPSTGPPPGVPVLVAAVEIPAGATVRAPDLAVREWPAPLVPAGALQAVAAAEGRVLVGAAHAGEVLTDHRVVGAGPAPPGTSAVPLRIADAGIATMLVPGGRVDIATVGERSDASVVLATDAQVLAVLAEEKGTRGRLVLVALPRATAGRVAAAASIDQVSITLR